MFSKTFVCLFVFLQSGLKLDGVDVRTVDRWVTVARDLCMMLLISPRNKK